MLKRKTLKSHGKSKLSQYFQEFNEGDKVAIVREHSLNPAFPKRIQGKTGIVFGKKGRAYLIKLKDGEKYKVYIILPAHLIKLK